MAGIEPDSCARVNISKGFLTFIDSAEYQCVTYIHLRFLHFSYGKICTAGVFVVILQSRLRNNASHKVKRDGMGCKVETQENFEILPQDKAA